MLLSKIGSTLNIFKSQLSEEQLREARQEGRKAGLDEFVKAAAGEISEEDLERIKERLQESQRT